MVRGEEICIPWVKCSFHREVNSHGFLLGEDGVECSQL